MPHDPMPEIRELIAILKRIVKQRRARIHFLKFTFANLSKNTLHTHSDHIQTLTRDDRRRLKLDKTAGKNERNKQRGLS